MFQRKPLAALVAGALMTMAAGANAATTYFDNFTPIAASTFAAAAGPPHRAAACGSAPRSCGPP